MATPLMLPRRRFMRSLDTFPLEYGEIIRAHELVYGDNPFSSAAIARRLRRACELQAKSHLVHLREAFIESGGRPTGVAELVTTSAPAFTLLLRNVARLNSVTTDDRSEVTRAGARRGHSRGAGRRHAEPGTSHRHFRDRSVPLFPRVPGRSRTARTSCRRMARIDMSPQLSRQLPLGAAMLLRVVVCACS